MATLKSIMAITTLIISLNAYANTNDIKTLQKQLKPWQPLEITAKDSSLTVVLPSKKITSEAYNHLIMSGVCTPLWTHDTPSSFLKNVSEINIVNQYKSIGYTFEDPLTTCNEIAPLMEKPAQTVVLSKTHTYTGK